MLVDETDDEDEENPDEKNGEEGMDEDEEMVEFPIKDDDAEMGTDGRKTVDFQELDADEEDRQ